VADHGLDGGSQPELAFDYTEDDALLAGDEDACNISISAGERTDQAQAQGCDPAWLSALHDPAFARGLVLKLRS